MKSDTTKRMMLYLLFSFGVGWLCQISGCVALLRNGDALFYQAMLVLAMFCPLAAVLLTGKACLHEPTGIAWKPKGRGRYWLAAWFGPLVLTLLGMGLYFVVFPGRLDLSGSWLRTYSAELAVQGEWNEVLKSYLIQTLLVAVTVAPLTNILPALGEEAGWRGYMMPLLKERFGVFSGRLIGGVIWGVWHFPLMVLVGYEYGTDYLGAPWLGLIVWCVVCFALGALMDWLYEKSGSILVPALAHGAFNAVAGIPVILTDPKDTYYNVLGPMPIGLISVMPMLALAVWLTLRQAKKEE